MSRDEKSDPVHRPVRENKTGQRRERDAPLKMFGAILDRARGTVNVIEKREPGRRGKTESEHNPEHSGQIDDERFAFGLTT